jgi:hypothetical protein
VPSDLLTVVSCLCSLAGRGRRFPGATNISKTGPLNCRSLHYATPDFLLDLVTLIYFMRPSLRKGAHAVLSGAAWQEIRVRFGRDDKGRGSAFSGERFVAEGKRRSLPSPQKPTPHDRAHPVAADSGSSARGLASGSKPTLPRPPLQRKSALDDCHAASRGAGNRIPPCGPNASSSQT